MLLGNTGPEGMTTLVTAAVAENARGSIAVDQVLCTDRFAPEEESRMVVGSIAVRNGPSSGLLARRVTAAALRSRRTLCPTA